MTTPDTPGFGSNDPFYVEARRDVVLPFLRTPYNYDRNIESEVTGLLCQDESLAQQQFREDSDINHIVKMFGLTGEMPANASPPVYADFEEVFDFQTAQNAIVAANARFMALPAHVRARFHNDPQELLEFVEDDNNIAEAEKLGLMKPKPDTPREALPTPGPVVETSPPKAV